MVMKISFSRLLLLSLFTLSAPFLLFRCSNDDPAREQATKAALEKRNSQHKVQPIVGTTEPVRPEEVGQLPLYISSTEAATGAETCLSVTVARFNQIVSMQYTMKWDPQILRFKEVKNFGLPGLRTTNFGTRAADKGILAYSWFDANVKGITVPDGTKLYEVCFDVVGKAGSSSSLEFADKPVLIEISNSASQFLGIDGVNGKVRVIAE